MEVQLTTIIFTSADQIQKYWADLGKLGLQYHLDDEPVDCFDAGEICDILQHNNGALWGFCEDNNIDPWDHIELDTEEQ